MKATRWTRVACLTAGCLLTGVAACSIFESFDGYTGGSGGGDGGVAETGAPTDAGSGGDRGTPPSDGGASGDAKEAGPPPTMCSIQGSMGYCAPAPPPGWQGPVVYFEGPSNGSVPACALGYTSVYDGHGSPDGGPASCNACTCNASGVKCNVAVQLFSDPLCAVACSSTTFPAGGGCTLFAACGDAGSAIVNGMTTATGTCAAQGGGVSGTPPPSVWNAATRACAPMALPPQSGCSQGYLCAPPPPTGFPLRYCVELVGDAGCPPGPYSEQHTGYSSTTDTRGCSACSCQSPTCGPVGSSVCLDDNGVGPCCGQTTSPGPACVRATLTPHFGAAQTAAVDSGCAPSGGQPSGGVTPTGATTFCCVP